MNATKYIFTKNTNNYSLIEILLPKEDKYNLNEIINYITSQEN